MKKQIFISNAEKAAKCWNERLDKAMKEKGYSQHKLIKALNERYGTNFTQAMVSDWLHVGEPSKRSDGTERHIGFPVYTNMLIIADFLNVDVGYLTGETDMETFTVEKVSKYTNLSEEAINSVLKITGNDRSCINWGYESEKYRKVLNKLLISSEFIEFVKALGDMEAVYADKNKTQQPLETLCEELGTELFDVACKYNGFCTEELEGLHLSEEEIDAINHFDKAQDDSYSLYLKNEYDIKVCKYSAQEALTLLINRLYSDE